MRNGKLELALCDFFDHTSMEHHFERMAKKGWALDRMGIFWHYHRIEPKTLHYAVSYFPGGGFYEPPTEGEMTFAEYCEEAGWELAAEYGVIKIFCNEREHPVPLETQADLQVQNIHLATQKMRISYGVIGVIAWLIGIWFLLSLAVNFTRQFSNAAGCFLGICGLSLGIYAAYYFIAYYIWYRKAERNASEDQMFTPTKGNRWVMLLTVLVIPLAAYVFYLAAEQSIRNISLLSLAAWGIVYYIQDCLRNQLRNKRVRKGINRALNFAVAFVIFEAVFVGEKYLFSGEVAVSNHGFQWESSEKMIPLSSDDLSDGQGRSASNDIRQWNTSGNLFLSQLTAQETSDGLQQGEGAFYLQYVVTKVRAGVLYDLSRDSMRNTYRGEQPWQESRGWELPDGTVEYACETTIQRTDDTVNRYLICMNDRILKIDLNFVPDDQQRETIVRILGEI